MSAQLALLPQFEGARAHLACEDNLAFMRELPSERMKLIVTSPPYNIGKAYEKRKSLEISRGSWTRWGVSGRLKGRQGATNAHSTPVTSEG